MSNKKHQNAQLPDHDGPYFPSSVDELGRALDAAAGFNGFWLEKVAKRVAGFDSRTKATTSDDYRWFWAIWFTSGIGKVVILVPWSQDWDRQDGTQCDRSIAVHTKSVSQDAANEVIGQFIEQVRQQVQLDNPDVEAMAPVQLKDS